MSDKTYCVYILTNNSKNMYVGVTNNLKRRIWQHKNKLVEGFTKRYNISQLVYFEPFNYIDAAITREKAIKGWLREKKIALIESANPAWKDLAEDWFLPDYV